MSIEIEAPPEFEDPIERLVWLRIMLEDEESVSYLAHSGFLRDIIAHYIGNTILMVGDLQLKVKSLDG